MDFAGSNESRLSSLRRIVALIGNNSSPFRGLEFIYDTGERKRFCIERNLLSYDNSIESSFYIDGAAGERVSAVAVGYASSRSGIQCIEVRHWSPPNE
jgi:hypothetical protein